MTIVTPRAVSDPALQGMPAEDITQGILCMIVATIAFAITHALSKWLIATYPLGQVMFSRSLSGLLVCAAILLPAKGFSVFATRRPRDHILRGLSQSISQSFSVIAFGLMPLAGAIAINFSAPLWASLLAVLWLKERAGVARWIAVLFGFFGILVVTNPGSDSLTLGAIFALLNAIMVGTVTVAVRGMTVTESGNTLLIWQLAAVTVFHSFLLPFGVRWPTAAGLGLLILCGIANLIAQYFWTRAIVLAPTTAVSPFFYFMLAWALVLGFLIWGEVPSIALLIGSGIVVGSGLFLLWYESQRRKA